MNIYGDYQRQVMTAEICGFQIHGFDGDNGAAKILCLFVFDFFIHACVRPFLVCRPYAGLFVSFLLP